MHGGNRAAYLPAADTVVLPPWPLFATPAGYYGTAMHELAHATGHPSRLDRLPKNARYGDQSYAFEELVAEVGGAFTCAELGVPDSGDVTSTAAYLSSWLAVL